MESVSSLDPIKVEDEEIILNIKKLGMPYYVDSDSDHVSYCVTQEGTTPSWHSNIYQYLKNQTIPQYFDRNERI